MRWCREPGKSTRSGLPSGTGQGNPGMAEIDEFRRRARFAPDGARGIFELDGASGFDDALQSFDQRFGGSGPYVGEAPAEEDFVGSERLKGGIHQFIDEIRRPYDGDQDG